MKLKDRIVGGNYMPDDKETLHNMMQYDNENAEPEFATEKLMHYIK